MSQGHINGGDTRYPVSSSSNHIAPDRRRRGKNVNETYYNNSGPRDNRVGSGGYRGGNSRYSHRGSGGSGDGLHNSGYRGGSDYDSQPYQSGMAQGSPSEGHIRTNHSSHHQSQTHYQHYPQQQHHHSHHHQGKGLDYDSTSRQQRGSAMQHQPADHRNNVSQQADNSAGHPFPHSGFSGGGNTTHHHQMPNSNEVVVVASAPPEHSFPNASGHPPVTNHFQVPGHPPPAVGIIGFHPNTQPMFGTLALCHIPYGINPSSVISPSVYTQIIGSGFVTPGLPYNYPCGFPSQMVPAHPVIFQQSSPPQQVQQHYHHNAYQSHCGGGPAPAGGGMHNQPQQTNGDDCMAFDSSAILNPDADAFFPPAFPPDHGVEEGGSSPTSCNNEPVLETSEVKSDEQVTPRNDIDEEEEKENEEKGESDEDD